MICCLKRGIALLALAFLTACAPSVLEDAVLSAPVVVSEDVSAAPAAPTARRGARTVPRAGVVTAADIDDTLNLAAFTRYQQRKARALRQPGLKLTRPILVQLQNASGAGAPGLAYTLRVPGAGTPFHTGRSGVDGRIAVFPRAMGLGHPKRVELRVVGGEGQAVSTHMLEAGKARVVTLDGAAAEWRPAFLDLVFVLDTTGSMGDELAWLTKELKRLVRQARRAAPGADIRFGLVVYRDDGDAYVVSNYGFTARQSVMQRWLRAQQAAGGGDYPEAAGRALASAVKMNWRRGNGERLLFHIADAPARAKRIPMYLQAASAAAAENIQVFGIGASGVGSEAELLMRQAAVVSAGRYVFLTDDSGVGHAHGEPDVACYRVVALSNLVSRILRSELTGRRVEASAREVIREVGSYQAGRCLG